MTNNHVVNKGKDAKITVTLADLEELKAEVVGFDAETDLAVLKVKVNKTPIVIAPLGNSDELEIAEWLLLLATHLTIRFDRTVTVGVVSALGRSGLSFGNQSRFFRTISKLMLRLTQVIRGSLNIDGKVLE